MLEKKGYSDFYVRKGGFYRLLNINGKCVFLNLDNQCVIYENRPLGCRVYPLIYDEERGVVLDSECPLADSVGCEDLVKGVELIKLVLRELELTYNYAVNWSLVDKSIALLVSGCFS